MRDWLQKVLMLFVVMVSSVSYGQDVIPKILNGTPTDQFESVGIVGSRQFGGFCTGTLISPVHVLTAAHCATVIENQTSGTFEIGGEVYITSAIFVHEQYNDRTLDNDIAILELSEPVVEASPSAIFRGVPRPDDELTIVGFGSGGDAENGNDGTFGEKMVGTVKIDEVTETLIIWTFDDPEESNTGPGDSGGPGFLNVEGELLIASITSAGTEPDAGLGDISTNTNVSTYAAWVDSIVNDDQVADEPPTEEEDMKCPQRPVRQPPHRGDGHREDGHRPDFHRHPGHATIVGPYRGIHGPRQPVRGNTVGRANRPGNSTRQSDNHQPSSQHNKR